MSAMMIIIFILSIRTILEEAFKMFRSSKPGPHFHVKQPSHDNGNPILII